MKFTKYSKILTMAKEKVQEALAVVRSNEMKKKAEYKVAEFEKDIAEQEQKIQEMASTYPIDFEKIADALDECDLIKRRRDQLLKMISDLFD